MQINTTLYKKTKTGAVNQWSVFTEDEVVTVEWGQVDGKLQTESYTAEAKNIGRSNETSPEEQAISEAKAKWQKQLDKGYTEDPSGDVEVILPMKVKDYWDNMKNVVFPCYWEYKFDGVNVIVYRENGTIRFISRGGKDYPVIEHLVDEINEWMNQLDTDMLNGELYIHKEHLQDIQSAVKKHNNLTPQLKLVVFDLPRYGSEAYSTRVSRLVQITGENVSAACLGRFTAYSHDDLELAHTDAVDNGYEGIVIRNVRAKYEFNKRSSDVFKMKKALDAEFQITGYTLDKKGHAVFQCVTPEGNTFNVKCKGDDLTRQKIVELADEWVQDGKYLKIEFESYSKDRIPMKPIGLWIREVNEKGEVME